ncbi:immunity protein Imm33 domain-containing protein [Occallatibacter riparius]
MAIPQSDADSRQAAFCAARQIDFVASPGDLKSGFAISTDGLVPINGLRHRAEAGTTGWYIWCGEQFSVAPDFFAPIHTTHIYRMYPQLVRLLGLPPGSRFLLAGEYLDVWFDPALLHI